MEEAIITYYLCCKHPVSLNLLWQSKNSSTYSSLHTVSLLNRTRYKYVLSINCVNNNCLLLLVTQLSCNVLANYQLARKKITWQRQQRHGLWFMIIRQESMLQIHIFDKSYRFISNPELSQRAFFTMQFIECNDEQSSSPASSPMSPVSMMHRQTYRTKYLMKKRNV